MQTIAPGLWSNPTIWNTGKIPGTSDAVTINHQINLDADATVNGITINEGAELCIDSPWGITLQSSANIVVKGRFCAEAKAGFFYTIRFIGINEDNFVGGGMDVLDSDIGLWIVGNGQLDFQGVPKTAWTNSISGINQGQNYLQVKDFTGWNPNDELLIVPTQKNADNYSIVEVLNFNPASSPWNININGPLTNHPMINNKWTAEVANLIRNIRIEGTATGKSHIFIMSMMPQTLKFVALRYMGPRKDQDGDGIKELVTGRYAIHFHHSDDGSRGSIIEGCVCLDCDNHCYVPHASNGITMRNNIAFNVTETAFWYDFGQKTNDLVWENNLVANVKWVERSLDQDNSGAPTFGAAGFTLGFGDNNVCRGNVVVGTTGDVLEGAAYLWPELRNDADITQNIESAWTFENNMSHNCVCGEGVWQNNLLHHVILNSVHYNNDHAIFHGAYQNHYLRKGGNVFDSLVEIKAASGSTNRIRFEQMIFDANHDADYCIVLNEGPLNGVSPILFRACTFLNYRKGAIIDQNPGPGVKSIDIIDCGLAPTQYKVSSTALSKEVIRIQESVSGHAWKVTKSGSTVIAIFAPKIWGNGIGLLAQYFTPDFKTELLKRIEPNINIFDLTHPSINYLVPASFAARWTGKIQPQYSENYTFYCTAGGGVRLWVNNQILIDKWNEQYPGQIISKAIGLLAGQQYDFKLEYFNNDDRSECLLDWASTTLKREAIPMSQLYPATV